jgi:hypothetical protein
MNSFDGDVLTYEPKTWLPNDVLLFLVDGLAYGRHIHTRGHSTDRIKVAGMFINVTTAVNAVIDIGLKQVGRLCAHAHILAASVAHTSHHNMHRAPTACRLPARTA